MINSSNFINKFYSDLTQIDELPHGESMTSNEADFIQCEQDKETWKITRILSQSSLRPPTANGATQNQHSSAFALLLAYTKKEATDILKIMENYKINLEKLIITKQNAFKKILTILVSCTMVVTNNTPYNNCETASVDIDKLIDRTKNVMSKCDNVKKIIFNQCLYSLASEMITIISNPLLRNLNALSDLTFIKKKFTHGMNLLLKNK